MPRPDSLSVTPVTPVIGAEISGIDLTTAPPSDLVEPLRDLLSRHHVLFFRDQPVTPESLQGLGRAFGTLHIHPQGDVPGYPGVIEVRTDADSRHYAGHAWHTDASCEDLPPRFSILALNQIPTCGGDTLFANMHAAYEALSEPLRGFLDGLTALHSGASDYGGYFGMRPEEMRDGRYPEAVHPVVIRHPDNGRKALYVNETFTARIEDLAPRESQAVLDMLYRHIAEPRFQCRFRWSAGAIALWDDFSTQHLAFWDYHPQTRSGYRATATAGKPER